MLLLLAVAAIATAVVLLFRRWDVGWDPVTRELS